MVQPYLDLCSSGGLFRAIFGEAGSSGMGGVAAGEPEAEAWGDAWLFSDFSALSDISDLSDLDVRDLMRLRKPLLFFFSPS